MVSAMGGATMACCQGISFKAVQGLQLNLAGGGLEHGLRTNSGSNWFRAGRLESSFRERLEGKELMCAKQKKPAAVASAAHSFC